MRTKLKTKACSLAASLKGWSVVRGLRRGGLMAMIVVVVGIPLLACQVPVFRYALERWNADRYQVYVVHKGGLSDSEHQAAVAALRNAAKTGETSNARIDLQVVDVGQSTAQLPPVLDAWWQSQQFDGPEVVAYYPPANGLARNLPMFHAPLSTASVDQLLDSPVRRELVKRLGQGDSAVWIFVPCGREAEDRRALDTLRTQLLADAEWLQLPTPEELEVEPEVLAKTKVPLKIQFSVVTLNREDAAERFLLESLLLSEEDLVSFDQPLAFPVFGQGRVLYCLVGNGIAEDTIREASAFMAGPCSCQVKNQNPGFDLLLATDWKKTLGDVLISEPIETLDDEALEPVLLTIPPGRK